MLKQTCLNPSARSGLCPVPQARGHFLKSSNSSTHSNWEQLQAKSDIRALLFVRQAAICFSARQRRPWEANALRPRGGNVACTALRIDNYELVVGDALALICFTLWKQVAAIVAKPDFPGWLAPLSFNPVAVADFTSFCLTLVLTWVTSCALVGGYKGGASRDLPTALRATSLTWLVSMPVILAQLILVTALESRALVGQPGFGSILPLAASGPGEPLPSAAGVLGLMAGWRAYYTTNLDWFADVSEEDKRRFREAVATTILMSGGSIAILQVLYLVLDHDLLEATSAALSFAISESVSAQSAVGA